VTDILKPDASPQAAPELDLELLPDSDEVNALVESVSPGRMALRRFRQHRLAMISVVVFGIIALFIIFAPITARYGEIEILPPINGKRSFNPPSSHAWFGTDQLNRDLYSRIIWGGRVSLFIGLTVAIFASIIGIIVGAVAGYRRGLLDDVLMRTTDLFLSFPTLVLLLVLRGVFSEVSWLSPIFGDLKSIRFIIVLLVVLSWMGVARIVRGTVLSLKEREFVEASIAVGSSAPRIVVRHLIPNSIGPIIVALTTSVVVAIIAESTLAFFGYGIDPVYNVSWGGLLGDAKGQALTGNWWIIVFPAAVFVITVICINFIGDAVRDAFDPKQGQVKG
jgi:peptide/nickel transport system permease protein